jgi:hypothetical protein
MINSNVATPNRSVDGRSLTREVYCGRATKGKGVVIETDHQGPGQNSRHQTVERYRRLLKTATEERRSHLGHLIVEAQQKQKDAGDSEYQY